MHIHVKKDPQELLQAKQWWGKLEIQWKMALNEAVFKKGPTLEPPTDDELMVFLIMVDTLRFAGPGAYSPNMSFQLTNLSGLAGLLRLKYLSITNMNLTSLKELAKHINLQNLFVNDNQITSLDGIQNLVQLKDLYIQNNEITDLTPIKKLTQLTTIYATGNKLKTINGFTDAHADTIRKFHGIPNEDLRDKEIIKFQNTFGIICLKG